MTKRNDLTCEDCYFRRAGLCALPTDAPCPTFRLHSRGSRRPPRPPPPPPRPPGAFPPAVPPPPPPGPSPSGRFRPAARLQDGNGHEGRESAHALADLVERDKAEGEPS